MYKVTEHKRLSTGGYKGPLDSGADIEGDNWTHGKAKRGDNRIHSVKGDNLSMKKGKKRKGGKKPLNYSKGGLHRTTGTPSGKKIPKSKLRAALAGKYGAKGKKQAEMAKNVFHVSTKKKGGKKSSY